jgi:hypothetical protein
MRTSSRAALALAWCLVGCGASSRPVERTSPPADPPVAATSEEAQPAAGEPSGSWLELASLSSRTFPHPLQVDAHQARAGTAVLVALDEGARVHGLEASSGPSVPAIVMIREGTPVWSHRIALADGVRALGARVLVTERGVVYAAVGTVPTESLAEREPHGNGLVLTAVDASSGAEIARTTFEAVGPAMITPGDLVVSADGDPVVALYFEGSMRVAGERSRTLSGRHQNMAIVRLSPDLSTLRSATVLRLAVEGRLDALENGGVDAFVLLSGRASLRVGRHTLRAAPDVWGRLVAVRLDAGGEALDLASIALPVGADLGRLVERGGARALVMHPAAGAHGQVRPPPCVIHAPRARLADLRIECEDTPGVYVPSADGSRGWVLRTGEQRASWRGEPPDMLAIERASDAGADVPPPATLDVRASWNVIPLAVLDPDSTPRLLVLAHFAAPSADSPTAFVALVALPPPGARADVPAR